MVFLVIEKQPGLCNEVVEGSHVCTPDDMLNTIALNSLMPSENVWVSLLALQDIQR